MNTLSQPEYHWLPEVWLQFWIDIGRRQTEQAIQMSIAAYSAWVNAALQSSVQLLSTANAPMQMLSDSADSKRFGRVTDTHRRRATDE